MTATVTVSVTMRRIVFSVALAAALACVSPTRADYEAGQRAWEAGDAPAALAEWRASSAGGDSRSMLALGRAHVRGLGVAQDYVEAHMWLNLAAGRGSAEAAVEREIVAARMTADQVASAQRRAAEWRPKTTADVFRDCPECPEMVLLPVGGFEMGSPSSEAGRWDNEGPRHTVRIGYRLAVGRYEVTVGEFGRFVAATGHEAEGPCWTAEDGKWGENSDRGWRDPGFRQADQGPVVCVSWDDAQAYANWLSLKTGTDYRLLTEAEWEYAARAGALSPRSWDAGTGAQCRHANGADLTFKRLFPDWDWGVECDDGAAHAAPVGSYAPNDFGLHDMLGNAWEWTADCWNADYAGAATDGSARMSDDCPKRVVRGGSWGNESRFLRFAVRLGNEPAARIDVYGFRIARTVD